ncbi:MAG TPA: hypothetical protein VGP83_03700 [Pyrinomonadaceae bacterium]|nr:hypothetical protein [Pyrinomonadaceae bacterium]
MTQEQDLQPYRIQISKAGSVLLDEAVDGFFVLPSGSKKRALICSYNYSKIRLLLTRSVFQAITTREAAAAKGVGFDELSKDCWKAIEQSPDVALASAAMNLKILGSVERMTEVCQWVERIMKFIEPSAIAQSMETGYNIFTSLATDNLMEEFRVLEGVPPRNAKQRQAFVMKLAREIASNLARIARPGRRPGSKSQANRFTYEKLESAVIELGTDTIPKQAEVARRMGYKGANADDQLRVDLRRRREELNARGYQDHRWKKLCKHILDRHYK